jgi:hypothetical protein
MKLVARTGVRLQGFGCPHRHSLSRFWLVATVLALAAWSAYGRSVALLQCPDFDICGIPERAYQLGRETLGHLRVIGRCVLRNFLGFLPDMGRWHWLRIEVR